MKSKKLVMSLALCVVGVFNAYAETQFNKHIAYSKDGVIVESYRSNAQNLDAVQYISPNEEMGGGTIGPLPPENVFNPDWDKYMELAPDSKPWDIKFRNKSNECRIAVTSSSNSEGINLLYHRKVEAGESFSYPPRSPLKYPFNQGAQAWRSPITTLACDQPAPGIKY